ncbi:hypothetical protein GGS24DRAFT_496162 [Hypoxylon argillaceum]|nr:hypothetical protein GGS24DRAFT_496162 [Hypoxylon argillaceum]
MSPIISLIITSTLALSATPTTATSLPAPQAAADYTMGFIGCSMAENVAQGYASTGGRRMWGPYGTGALVVQSWTDPNSAAWQKFDTQAARYGKPTSVLGADLHLRVPGRHLRRSRGARRQRARAHAATNATIYLTGQPLYDAGQYCFLAGQGGAELTDGLARRAGNDSALGVVYPGSFLLHVAEVQDGCHANAMGQQSLGRQAMAFWG